MSVGDEAAGSRGAEVDEDDCVAEPWAYLPSDSFRIRVEPPRSDGPWRDAIDAFLTELGGSALMDSGVRVVGNALQMDSLDLRPGDEGFPGMVVALAPSADAPVELEATGNFASADIVPLCQQTAPEGFLVSSMPMAGRPHDPSGPIPLSVTWRLYVEDGALTLQNHIVMQPGAEPLDVEEERDTLSRQSLEWFENALPELSVTYEDQTLSMTLAADTEAEVEALLGFFREMVPAVVLTAEP